MLALGMLAGQLALNSAGVEGAGSNSPFLSGSHASGWEKSPSRTNCCAHSAPEELVGPAANKCYQNRNTTGTIGTYGLVLSERNYGDTVFVHEDRSIRTVCTYVVALCLREQATCMMRDLSGVDEVLVLIGVCHVVCLRFYQNRFTSVDGLLRPLWLNILSHDLKSMRSLSFCWGLRR